MIRILFIFVIFFIAFTSGFSQFQYYSLDVPTDARSIALGESFVAVKHPISSLMYNPASLSPDAGLSIAYSARRANFYEQVNDLTYYNISASYSTSVGEFGFLYNQYYQGEWTITTPSYPDGIGKAKVYDHFFLGKYSRAFGKHITAGVALKIFNTVLRQTSGPPNTITQETSSLPFLLDAGCMYSTSLLFSPDVINDSLTLGIAFQNFGTDFRQLSGTTPQEKFIKLPRYLRLGFSYDLTVPTLSENSLIPLRVFLTGEYRNLLNSYSESEKDYWGFGSEVTLFELLSLRLGGFIKPNNSAYGYKGVPNLQYGIGMLLPLKYIGIHTFLRFRLDYAGIPLKPSPYDYFYLSNSTTVLHTVSIGIEYPQLF